MIPSHHTPAKKVATASEAKPANAKTELAAVHAAAASKKSDAAGDKQLAVRRHLERFKYYPASARRRDIAGDVEVAFHLRSDGMAEQVLVMASSGYEILDRAALETVNRAQPFPATGGQYQFRLRFQHL